MAGSACAAQTRPPTMVALRNINSSIRQDMRYAGPDNFTGRPLPGYRRRECYLQRAAALALKRVQADLAAQGLSLKVYDCYRPTRAVAGMARWAATCMRRRTRAGSIRRSTRRICSRLATSPSHSAHSRGVAVDLTIVPRKARLRRPSIRTPHYGSCAGPASRARAGRQPRHGHRASIVSIAKARTYASGLTPEQRANRDRLLQAMTQHGFHQLFSRVVAFLVPRRRPAAGIRF